MIFPVQNEGGGGGGEEKNFPKGGIFKKLLKKGEGGTDLLCSLKIRQGL